MSNDGEGTSDDGAVLAEPASAVGDAFDSLDGSPHGTPRSDELVCPLNGPFDGAAGTTLDGLPFPDPDCAHPEHSPLPTDAEILADRFVDPREAHELVQEMRNQFGLRSLDVYELPSLANAAEHPGTNRIMSHDDSVIYDSDFLTMMALSHGPEVITGILAHEVGHSLVAPDTQPHDHEFTADVVAGMISERRGCSPEAMEHFYLSAEARGECDTHPHGFFRLEKFREGYELARAHPSESLLTLLGRSSVSGHINRVDFIFDPIFPKTDQHFPEPPQSVSVLQESPLREVFAGHASEPAFGGGLGYCNIKCMHESEDQRRYVASSDWASEL